MTYNHQVILSSFGVLKMEKEEIIKHVERLLRYHASMDLVIEATEFLRICAGPKSHFYIEMANTTSRGSIQYIQDTVYPILKAFHSFLKSGLSEGISIERKAQIDVVSDYLEQAINLLADEKIHPSAPCVLIGASLEEFLRNFVEEQGLDIQGKKASIDSYKKVLRTAGLIEKQDAKDIDSVAGLRNDAAHGHWDNVNDRTRINNMLEMVNLIIRKYS
jgi:hypothetical protein